MENNEFKTSEEVRENIQKRIISLERRNYNTREFSPVEINQKIKKIIEEEVNKQWLSNL